MHKHLHLTVQQVQQYKTTNADVPIVHFFLIQSFALQSLQLAEQLEFSKKIYIFLGLSPKMPDFQCGLRPLKPTVD